MELGLGIRKQELRIHACLYFVGSVTFLWLAAFVIAGCTREDPARSALRARLKEAPQMSQQDLGRTLDEVAKSLAGKTLLVKVDAATKEMNQEQRDVVLGMLTDRIGVFDEGLRTDGGVTVRVLNAPGLSTNPEYSAARRLLIDIETFVPRRFEFSYEFPGMGDYAFDLALK